MFGSLQFAIHLFSLSLLDAIAKLSVWLTMHIMIIYYNR